MQARTKIVFAMIASAAVGGLAVQGLHAAQSPPAYYVTGINVTNPEAFGNDFLPKVRATIKAHDGRILAAGGVGGGNNGAKMTVLEGTATPNRLAIVQFGSMDELNAWWNDPAFKDSRQIGDKYATFRSFAVEGMGE